MSSPYTPPAYHTQPKNGMGTASLVLGIVGLLFSWIPFIGIVAWPLVILGFIFGFIGLSRARKRAATNPGVALTGIILSGIGLIICFIYLFGSAKVLADTATNPALTPAVIPTAEQLAGGPLPTPLPPGSFTDGKYQVGVEIEPGTYKTDGPVEGALFPICTWEKYKTADDTSLATSADTVQGKSTVKIRSGGFMKFSGGCTWKKQ
jgi:hypothetical protein